MIFSTYKFIFLFLPIVFSGYFILNKFRWHVAAKFWLVLASLYFYAQGSKDFFLFFVVSILFNYAIGTILSQLEKKDFIRITIFTIGILANCTLLGYYKYSDFFIENVNLFTGREYQLMRLALPIGISFFTFQQIAFLVDSYRGETKECNILNYILFITFFPQLIVGPIIHHEEIIPQFADDYNLYINYNNISKGMFIFAIGCAKKILLADPLTEDAQLFFDSLINPVQCFDAWYYSIEYTISYYFDLSGYADMAIGLGWVFNISIPSNFDSPYKAKDFQTYWRRWHMTLSRFLGNYVFRYVFRKDNKYRNYYVATMVTFLVSGFWHGAGWTFVVWGIINGIFVCIAAFRNRKGIHAPDLIAFTITGLGIILTRVLFVSNTFNDAWTVYSGMLNINSLLQNGISSCSAFLFIKGFTAITLIAGICICWFAPNTKQMTRFFKSNIWTLVYAAILMVICILNMNKVASFLYFQF